MIIIHDDHDVGSTVRMMVLVKRNMNLIVIIRKVERLMMSMMIMIIIIIMMILEIITRVVMNDNPVDNDKYNCDNFQDRAVEKQLLQEAEELHLFALDLAIQRLIVIIIIMIIMIVWMIIIIILTLQYMGGLS